MRFENLQPLSKESLEHLKRWAPAVGATAVDLVHPITLIRCEAKVILLDQVAKPKNPTRVLVNGKWQHRNRRRSHGPAKRTEAPPIRKLKFEGPTP